MIVSVSFTADCPQTLNIVMSFNKSTVVFAKKNIRQILIPFHITFAGLNTDLKMLYP